MIFGVLFFATPTDSTLYAGGKALTGKAMKVLWVVTDPFARGTTLDAAGIDLTDGVTYHASFPGVGDGQYPSILDLPSAGCWRLQVESGTVQGRVTLEAATP